MADSSSRKMAQFEESIAEDIVAMIRQEPAEIGKLNGLEFQNSYDDLDYLTFAILSLPSGNKVALVRHQHSPEPGIEICVSHNQQNVAEVIKETLDRVNLTSDDLTWIHPEYQQIYESRKSPIPSRQNPPKNFSGIDFSKCALQEVQLEQANLRNTTFKEAELNKANLQHADLKEANLEGADLSQANLSGANLTRTKALKTNFEGATLTGVCIEDWNIDSKTNFNNVICDYVYLKEGKQKRFPHNPNKNFAPGQFTEFFQKKEYRRLWRERDFGR
jgi:uncharacterized protein YjbI with pentapeptide repeats